MANSSKRQRRLWDTYTFPGFRPQPTVRGVFGDPKARIITLARRAKNTHSDTFIVSFSHHGGGLEANAPAEAPGSRSPRRAIRSNVGVTMGCAVLGSPCRAGTAHVMLFRPIGIERRNNEVTPERPDLAEEAIVVFCRRCRNW